VSIFELWGKATLREGITLLIEKKQKKKDTGRSRDKDQSDVNPRKKKKRGLTTIFSGRGKGDIRRKGGKDGIPSKTAWPNGVGSW